MRLMILLYLLPLLLLPYAQAITTNRTDINRADIICYHHYQAKILRIIDGDTFTAEIYLFPKQTASYAVRIRGMDAPEITRKKSPEYALGQRASAYLQQLLPVGSMVILDNLGFDSFGRILADVRYQHGKIAQQMIAANHAKPANSNSKSARYCKR